MKKLKLNLRELKVESFEISHKNTSKGTVQGYVTQIISCERVCHTHEEACFTDNDPTCNGVGGCTGAIICVN